MKFKIKGDEPRLSFTDSHNDKVTVTQIEGDFLLSVNGGARVLFSAVELRKFAKAIKRQTSLYV